jgi:hypothetical protein
MYAILYSYPSRSSLGLAKSIETEFLTKSELQSHLILVSKLSLSCPLHFLSFGYCCDKTIASPWNLELRILIICPLVNLMLSKISLISTMQRLQQERYAVILWTLFSDILDPTTISHLIVCDQITKDWVKAIQSEWNLLQKKPTWSVYAGYILLRFCFLFLPNYHKL